MIRSSVPVPVITASPTSFSVDEWRDAVFSVEATGFNLGYQWRKDGVPVVGATNATLSLSTVHPLDAGSYTVEVWNDSGSVTSAPPAVLTVGPPPAGSVVAWGDDRYGQVDVPIAAQRGVVAIAVGAAHTLALKADGSVVAWGANDNGQTTVPALAMSGVTAIAAGQVHSVALKEDGSVVQWGGGEVAVPAAARSGVVSIAAGPRCTVALRSNGEVVVWGDDSYGQEDVPLRARSGVTAIAAGEGYILAIGLRENRSVLAWGDDKYGMTEVPVETSGDVAKITTGYLHAVALRSDGTVVEWRGNSFGHPTVSISPHPGVTDVAANYDTTFALKEDGTVEAWGPHGVPVAVPAGLRGVTAISSGEVHTVALIGAAVALRAVPSGDGLVLSWPADRTGQILQSTASLATPIVWSDSTAVPALVGGRWSVAVVPDGKTRLFRLHR